MALGQDAQPSERGGLSQARADFVDSLSRRLEGLQQAFRALEEHPEQKTRKENLLRRIHALGSAARVLGFAAAAEALAEAETALQRSGEGTVSDPDLAEVGRALASLPSLVHSRRGSMMPDSEHLELESALAVPLTLLVFGSDEFSQMLRDEGKSFAECLQTETLETAIEYARAQGPDVAIIDTAIGASRELIERLMNDPEIGSPPIVALSGVSTPEEASTYIALGVARVLPKPVTPEALWSVARELARQPSVRAPAEPIGDVSLQQLADRIQAEVRRGLLEAADSEFRNIPIALGSGAEVLAAVWGAVARVRQLVSLRSQGRIQFDPSGPEGAIPLAATLRDRGKGERGSGQRGRGEELMLRGRRVVVADDDPAVAWFLSGLFKSVGAQVFEAHDGQRALDLTYQKWPDLVVSDILMPKIDGFSLCREIKRDVAVRDVPVILISWKEDLLQRVRELGADADGYLRKEAGASTVMERVHEVLRPRARVEARLRAGCEVSGRLDGLTPRLVLQLSCSLQKNAKLTLRDAAYLYEVQIRGGRVASAVRTSSDGSLSRGEPVLSALLGVSAGRFSVTPDSSTCRTELSGSLEQLLEKPIERARAGQRAVAAEVLVKLNRIDIDRDAISGYLASTPEPAARFVRQLCEGVSPRDLMLTGAASARLLEAVLSDVARHGAIRGVEPASAVPSIRPAASEPPEPAVTAARAPSDKPERSASEDPIPTPFATATQEPTSNSTQPSSSEAEPTIKAAGPLFTFQLSPEPPPAEAPAKDAHDGMQEEAAAASSKGSQPSEATSSDDGDELSALLEDKPSSMRMSQRPTVTNAIPSKVRGTFPGMGILGGSRGSSGAASQSDQPGVDLGEVVLGQAGTDDTPLPRRAFSSEVVPSQPDRAGPDDQDDQSIEEALGLVPPSDPSAAQHAPLAVDSIEAALGLVPRGAEHRQIDKLSESALEPSDAPAAVLIPPDLDQAPKAPPRDGSMSDSPLAPVVSDTPSGAIGWMRVVGATSAAFVLSYALVNWVILPLTGSDGEAVAVAPAAGPETSAAAVLENPPPPPPAAKPGATSELLPIPPEHRVPAQMGLLEIRADAKHIIYVSGEFQGPGPVRLVPLAPGQHQVTLRLGDEETSHDVRVEQGKLTRLTTGQ
jgi:DNA-binding response OmpR family regulator/HPt (histidine-containing phosphotransfer) domain-containing protein